MVYIYIKIKIIFKQGDYRVYKLVFVFNFLTQKGGVILEGNNNWKGLVDVKTESGTVMQGRWNNKSLVIETRKKGGGDTWKEVQTADKLKMYKPAAEEDFKRWAKAQ
ncbi:hypothetical protein K8R62_01530 [bacterium]|nr:hypothetical protein [bacterium]